MSNPWDINSGSPNLGAILRLAERTGHLPHQGTFRINDASYISMEMERQIHLPENSHSLQLIQQLRELTRQGKEFDKVSLDIQCRLQDKETSDITHADLLESKISQLKEMASHLQSVVKAKHQLITCLQQPFVGDYIKIEAVYHRHVKEMFPLIASCLADLATNLNNIEWSKEFSAKDSQLDGTLSCISSSLAQLQTNFQSLCQIRECLE
ncbi:AUGMIN subunit 2-like [Anneissia japonica]|uniref:AUGMIN subunit 2-like n=1 Tax=Anneissia japonica TaxID=1529436 RepID=UPI00142593D3|nr:AUGMIN subunit 2-like [Anneissia japonica]